MGVYQEPEFLWPELGKIPSGASTSERRLYASRLFTHPQNGRLARTIVNRYWQRLMGKGLVEPVDDMDAKPSNPDELVSRVTSRAVGGATAGAEARTFFWENDDAQHFHGRPAGKLDGPFGLCFG